MNKVQFLATSRDEGLLSFFRDVFFTGSVLFKRLASCLIFAALFLSAYGQLSGECNIKAQNFTIDNLQNLYIITPENEVVKYDQEGRELFRYPNKTLGQAAFLDATNPFHLLLFLPEYQNVLTLDRTLNLTGQFNLFQFGFFRVNAVGMASDGHLWVYDEAAFRLKKVAADGTVKAESNDLSISLGKAVHPNFLTERQQQVFLNDPDVGILVFDIFGQYLKTIEIPGLQEFQVLEDRLIYCREDRLWSFHLIALLEQAMSLPVPLPAQGKLGVGKGRIYILENGCLKNFPF
jgi:hypothetical protein